MPVQILVGAEPFFIPGGSVGCLCLHGLTGTPQEMAWLGQHMAEQGSAVYVPRLTGHGINPSYLTRTRWQDWYASALDGYHLLRRECDQVFVMGLSMGGLLTLLLAASEPVDGAAVLAAPLAITSNPAMRFIHLLRHIYPYVPTPPAQPDDPLNLRITELQRTRGERITGRVSYNSQYTTAGLSELVHLQQQVIDRLGLIIAPLLLAYSEGDQTVNIADLDRILANVASRDVEVLRLVESDHILTNDVDHPRVFEAVRSFVATHTVSDKLAHNLLH